MQYSVTPYIHIISKDKLLKGFTVLSVVILALTNIYHLKIGGIDISIYIIASFLLLFLSIVLTSKVPIKLNLPIIIIASYMVISTLINLQNVKITSILYSLLFISFYLFHSKYSTNYFDKDFYCKVLESVLYLFFFTLILSQLLIIVGLANLTMPDKEIYTGLLHGRLGIILDTSTNSYRFSSLSSEPSYAAFIVVISFFSLIKLGKKYSMRKNLILWLIMLYMIISFRSAFGLLLLALLFLSQIKLTPKRITAIFIFLFLGVALIVLFDIGVNSLDRLIRVLNLFFSDPFNFAQNLKAVDGSAFYRIGPFFTYLDDVSLLDYQFYLGNGPSSSALYFTERMFTVETSQTLQLGFIPAFIYDYGIIGFSLVIYFILKLIKFKILSFEMIFMLLLFTNANFNTQLFWFSIYCLTMNNWYIKQNRT